MTEKTSLFYDSAADAARAAGVSSTLIIDQCKTGAIPGAYQSSDGWWRVPVDGMRAAGHEVTGEGAHAVGPYDRKLPEPTMDMADPHLAVWESGVTAHPEVVYVPHFLPLDDVELVEQIGIDLLAAAAHVRKQAEKGADHADA